MSWLFSSDGQSTGASVLASVLPMNIQGLFPLGLTGLISLQRALKSLLQHHNSKASILWHSALFMAQLSHPYMTTGPITSRQLEGEKVEAVTDFLFLGTKNPCGWSLQP